MRLLKAYPLAVLLVAALIFAFAYWNDPKYVWTGIMAFASGGAFLSGIYTDFIRNGG